MTSRSNISLPTPPTFVAFPYHAPYQIQIELMQHLYEAIEGEKLAVIESPTGTGKTLSLLCASLTWLCDNKIRSKKGKLAELKESLNTGTEPEWVSLQTYERMKRELERDERDFESHLSNVRMREEVAKRRQRAKATKRPRFEDPTASDSDEQYLLDSDKQASPEGIEKELSRWMTVDTLKTDTPKSPVKIFYASRTHSQLSQVLYELTKLHLESSIMSDNSSLNDSLDIPCQSYKPRALTLASRSHLCINEQLRSNTKDLDEACRNLLQGPLDKRCSYLPPHGDDSIMMNFRDSILASTKDIEDLIDAGKSLHACPYFGSRSAVPFAEFIALPYNILLHKASREALEIDLTGQIVIIDEAHNLIETILQLHSVDLPFTMLHSAIDQLQMYINRFYKRLSAMHVLHLKRISLFLSAISQHVVALENTPVKTTRFDIEEIGTVSDFVDKLGTRVNGINLLELGEYLRSNKIAQKVGGYAKRTLVDSNGAGETASPIRAIEAFIMSLVNDTEDGRVSVYYDTQRKLHIKYQHLNPATHFSEIISSARCVVLAGGTMSPIPDVVMQLSPSTEKDRLSIFSCGHVVPSSSIRCIIVGKGPSGKDFQFKLKQRQDTNLLGELGNAVINIANIVPHGMIVFFPSYSFIETVKGVWKSTGLIDRLQKKKHIFYEPGTTAEVDGVLRAYAQAVSSTTDSIKGAILFAVVGAKLSEGLNFSDELARAVVLVGLPYPNIASPELKERMKYVTELRKRNGDSQGMDAGNELYENLCMRAVNQSIGRAIRHQNDWSCLILIDKRYESTRIRNKLPGWINESIRVTDTFGQCIKGLADFYKEKKSS